MSLDRNADPESMTLDMLPVDVLLKILEPLDVKNKIKLREVSKTMLYAVDKFKMEFDRISIACLQNSVRIYIRADGYFWRKDYSEESDGGNYVEIALQVMKLLLKPSKIRAKQFKIYSKNSDNLKPIVNLLGSISKTENSKFHVENAKIVIDQRDLALKLLSVMRPRILETMDIGFCNSEFLDMNEIKYMEQFKQAKTVDLSGLGFIQSANLELFSNFESFRVEVESMEPDDVKRLRDNLTKPNTFKKCLIISWNAFENMAGMGKVFGRDDVPNGRWNTEVKHVCDIENSNKRLRFFIRNDCVAVEKGDHIELEAMRQEYGDDFYDDPDFETEWGKDNIWDPFDDW